MIQTDRMHLMFGGCLERMREIPDGSIDLVLTDPPYGTTACKWDSVIPLPEMWAQLKRVIKPNGAIVMTASQPFTTSLIASNMAGFKYCWYWDKSQVTNFLNSKKQPLRRVEDVAVFYAKQPTYSPQMREGKAYKITRKHGTENYGAQTANTTDNKGVRFPDGVIRIPQVRERGGHPTQKPVALMEYLIKTYTNPDETVLDFTMGSGTTGVAAMNLNRKFIGIELDPTYYGVACGRVVEAAGIS